MKRRRVILILIAFVGVSIVVALFCSAAREPTYEGRTLTFWLALSSEPSRGEGSGIALEQRQTKAAEAVLHIGTNGLPWLLKWIRYEPKPWKDKFHAAVRKVPGGLGRRLGLDSLFADKSNPAVTGFMMLGSRAKPAIPELIRLLGHLGATNSPDALLMALGLTGGDALPPVVALLTNQQAQNRHLAALAMGHLKGSGTDITSAVPVLMQCLTDPDERIAGEAARLLGWIGFQSGMPIVSALMESLNDSRVAVRRAAAGALGNFHEYARPAVPDLVRCLADHDWQVALAAVFSLGQLRLEPDVVVPALAASLEHTNRTVRVKAMHSISLYGNVARQVLPDMGGLVKALNDSDIFVRKCATNAVYLIAPDFLPREKTQKVEDATEQ